MDRNIMRNDINDKKTDCKIKDSGDSKKSDKSRNSNVTTKVVHLESGDSGVRQINKPEQARHNNDRKKPANEDIKSKYLTHGTAEKDFPQRSTYDKELLGKSYSEIRKRIRDKYTFKLNVPVNNSEHLSLFKSRKGGTLTLNSDGINPPKTVKIPSDPVEKPATKPLPEKTTVINENQYTTSLAQTDFDFKPELIPEKKRDKTPVKPDKNARSKKRKPIIKTIVSNTDTARIFKAVTFVDHRNSTPLEIKIPGENVVIKKQQKVSKYTETSPFINKTKSNLPAVSKVRSKSSKESMKREEKPSVFRRKPERRRGKKLRQFASSPDKFTSEPTCPLTEVARWAPASIDSQTKPYYEAWVDTTLTATSKHSKKDKYFYEYQNRLLQSFKRALEERAESPDLFYTKFADEKYAGKIKIRQGGRKKREY